MIASYLHTSIILSTAWYIYATCQNDTLLPTIAGTLLFLTFILRLKNFDKQFVSFARINLSTIIIFSFSIGWIWGRIFPAPEIAYSPFPALVSAVQAGSIIGAVFIWLKPFSQRNVYHLTFLAWLNVAVSINVPFGGYMLSVFCLFCVLSTAIIILQTTKKPTQKKYTFLYYRDFIIFSTLLIMGTTSLFYGVSKSIVVFDRVFMGLMSNYITPNQYSHFLNIGSTLSLESPGRSARDRRPIMEVRTPEKTNKLYLKMQTFETYMNGSWDESLNTDTFAVPTELIEKLPTGKITMFTSLKNIIPAPFGVQAAKGSTPYTQSLENLLYTEDEQSSRTIHYSYEHKNIRFDHPGDMPTRYIKLNDEIRVALKEISSEIFNKNNDAYKKYNNQIKEYLEDSTSTTVREHIDDYTKTFLIRDFFKENFKYTLNIDFSANNESILRMIEERKPAYCSYFATAMVLLLRAEGIPARVATGLLTYEKSDPKTNTFIARVNNAHAWVEVLLPKYNPEIDQTYYRWMRLDPTPSAELRQVLAPKYIVLQKMAERLWIHMLRFKASIEDINPQKLKLYGIFTLIILLLLINIRKIFGMFVDVFSGRKIKRHPKVHIPSFLRTTYHQYERLLKVKFNEVRKPDETDRDVLKRLEGKNTLPSETIGVLGIFVDKYHAVRFGEEKANLKEALEEIKKL